MGYCVRTLGKTIQGEKKSEPIREDGREGGT